MVMEEQQPSPQSVGREFVRQYYTLLNKAPSHLHRFYNNNSSFIHGESTLVVGQKNIHNRIQQLNFRDCHAKISQVDAQATLGNGVVVQVTGELSNDGQPMRRFTQTFVLAAQSPKKYYVHNDIFRYQDMYSDEENDGESRSENDEEHEIDQQQQQQQQQQQPQVVPTNNLSGVTETNVIQQVQPQPQQQPAQQQQIVVPQPQAQQQAIYYSMPQTVVAGAPRAVPVIAAQAVPIAQFPAPAAAQQTQLNGGIVHEDLLATTMQQQTVPQQQPVPLPMQQMAPPVPANVAPAVVSVVSPQVLPQQPTQVAVVAAGAIPQVVAQIPNMPSAAEHSPPLPVMSQAMPVVSQVSSGPVPNIQPVDSNINTSGGSVSQKDDDMGNYSDHASSQEYIDEPQQMVPEKYEAPKTNEPKTYANLFKSTANINPSSPNSGYVPLPPVNQNHMNMNQQSQQQQSSLSSSSSSAYKTSESRMIDNNIQTGVTGAAPLPQRTNSTRINKDFEQRRPGGNTNTQQFSDSNQLFLGNVPHHATEDELKELFNRFGTVMDLRIHSKPGPKVPGIRNPQNYGFITYQDSQSVENCLSHCPLYYPQNSPDGQKLNVEEKKPRLRNPNDLPPRQSNNMSGNNGGNGNNMGNSQRPNMGPNRSLSNSGGMMRGNPGNNSLSRGTSGGPRMGGGFNRNDSRGPPGSGSQQSRGNGNSGSNAGGGGGQSYNRR